MLTSPAYVLITPARDEAQFIELTIKSVVAQTVRPMKWVIVSDSSTDGTDDIVNRYAVDHPWIELVRMPERRERHFAGKVHAFNAGRARLADLDFDVIGNLDADVSFEPNHFEFLVAKFAEDPRLGVVGAPFREGTYQYDYRFKNIENVWGGCQLFGRECFEDIGGYVPVKGGGTDHFFPELSGSTVGRVERSPLAKAAASLLAAVGNSTRRVRIPSLSATPLPPRPAESTIWQPWNIGRTRCVVCADPLGRQREVGHS